jgi:hypothetical protein
MFQRAGGNRVELRLVPYIRIYFDRGTGLAVIDTGPGTPPLKHKTVRFNGQMQSELAPVQDDTVRPRFWLSARHAVLLLHADGETVEVSTVGVPQCKQGNCLRRTDTSAPMPAAV